MTQSHDTAKNKAKRVVARLNGFGIALSHAQALEVVAAVYGDKNYQAMRARLSEQEPVVALRAAALPPVDATVKVFTVAMYRRHSDTHEIAFEAKTSVVCFTAQQARDFVFEEFWNPRLDAAGYIPSYETDVDSFEGVCDLDMLVEWLAVTGSRPDHGGNLSDKIWAALTKLGAKPAYGDEQGDPQIIEQALFDACRQVPDMGALMAALYAELPEGLLFMGPSPSDFDGYDGRLTFRKD